MTQSQGMSAVVNEARPADAPALAKLSNLDRFLPVSVLVFLGIPLLAGYLTRTFGERVRGRQWYEARFLRRVGPIALYGLLLTVVVLFALQGKTITENPLDVARIAIPLLAYFALMFGGGFALGRRWRASSAC